MTRRIQYTVMWALLSLAVGADAQETSGARAWLGVSGGWSLYAMGDVNEEINAIDAEIAPNFEEVNSGLSIGVHLGVDVGDRVRISGNFLRLQAGSDVADFSGSLDYDFAANVFYGSAEAILPVGDGQRLFLGGSAGLLVSAGSVDLSVAGVGASNGDVSGTGPYAAVHASIDIPLGSVVVLTPTAGVRYAVARDVELDGVSITDLDGDSYEVDYSGAFVGVTLRVFFASGDRDGS